MASDKNKECSGCIWFAVCEFEMPCDYYTPYDADDRMDARAETRRMRTFYDQLETYMESADDESDCY